jgi:two-component system chemotaxis response regulator CheB
MIQDSDQHKFAIVGIGSTAGGPAALERLFAGLASDLPAAFLLSQHMPKGFTRPPAERLSSISKWPVIEAHQGCKAKAGEALVAPGRYNMEISRGGIVRLEKHRTAQFQLHQSMS